jgi:hypothetical protein
MQYRITTAVLALSIAVASRVDARDLNAQNYLLGERASGMGGAFVSLGGDATSSYYNPAGLAGAYRKGISLSASAYQASSETYPKLIDADFGAAEPRLTGDMASATFATFPSSIVYVLPLDKNVTPSEAHHVLAFSVLVPDYDKLSAKIDTPQSDYAFQLKGSYLNQDMTYWLGPSYAVQLGGRVRLGVSVFALAHMTETQAKLGMKMTSDDGQGGTVNTYSTAVAETSGTAVTMLAEAGMQVDVTERLTFGATFRSPTFGSLYSSVSMLQLDSAYEETVPASGGGTAAGYVDRIEADKGIIFEYRRPLTVSAGISYRIPNTFTIALDGTYQAPQHTYNRFSGPLVYPSDPSGNAIVDPDRALDPTETVQTKQVVNANLGVEVNFAKSVVGRMGAFTNFGLVDRARDADPTHPDLRRFGASLGMGMVGEKGTTSFGLVYVYGSGTTPGLNDAFGLPSNDVKVRAHTVTAVLSGSANL